MIRFMGTWTFLIKVMLKTLSNIANICRKVNIIRNIEKWEKVSILRPILLFLVSYFFNLQFSLFIQKVSGKKYTKSPCSTIFREMRYKIERRELTVRREQCKVDGIDVGQIVHNTTKKVAGFFLPQRNLKWIKKWSIGNGYILDN